MMLHPDDGAPPAAGSRPVGDVSGRLPVPGLDTETRVLRRYFFQGTPSTGTMHFDVLIEPGDKIDASTDHLRYRYVDFMTQPGMHSVVNTDNNTVDIGELQHWLEVAKARTRIEAYPLPREQPTQTEAPGCSTSCVQCPSITVVRPKVTPGAS